ncbi:MAG: ABC transporter ATP-binding protein, partial [Acidimicrobiia bacterium]
MIEARSLTKRFGGRSAVEDVSLRVPPGEIVGFLGPNGAGKSTTMRMLLGLLRPTSGEVSVEGAVGYLPESFAAYDSLTVRKYLSFMARMKDVRDSDVERVLAQADIAALAPRPFGRLSKGQRQRVGLAQALLGSPPN